MTPGGKVLFCINYARHYLPKKLTRLQTGAMVVSPFLPPMTTVVALQAMRCVIRTILQESLGVLCFCLDVDLDLRNATRPDLTRFESLYLNQHRPPTPQKQKQKQKQKGR